MFNREEVKNENLHGYPQNRWMTSICLMQIMTLMTLTKTTTIMTSPLRIIMVNIVP